MRRLVPHFTFLLLLGLLAACGTEEASQNNETDNTQTGQVDNNTDKDKDKADAASPAKDSGIAPLPVNDSKTANLDALVGTYAGYHFNLTQVKNPLNSQWSESSSRLWMLHVIEKKDGKLVSMNKSCKLEQDETMGIQNTFSNNFINSMPVTYQEVKVDGKQINFTKVVSVLGANLADPFTDALPKDSNDPRVLDADNDNNPGVTINIIAKSGLMKTMLRGDGEIYITQKVFDERTSSLDANNNIRGHQTGITEMSVVGGKPGIMNRQIDSKPINDLTKNQFIMKKISAGQNCDDVSKLTLSFFQ